MNERVPAIDWLLNKYEENLNLRSAPDIRKYSDIALKLLSYIKDEVERAKYEEKVAKKIAIPVEILREKGMRLENALAQKTASKSKKKPKTEVAPDHIKKLEDSLLALKIFGGITKVNIPFDIPEDEVRLAELELVFNAEHENVDEANYEQEARELLQRYNSEIKKIKIAELNDKLANLNEEDEEYEALIREITDLQKS